jgi:phospholipid transport system transporter-binding protein
MIRHDGERLIVEGSLTMATVGALVAPGRAAVQAGAKVVDFSLAAAVDSSAIALILDWTRTAGRPLELSGVPPAIAKLADLYGLHEVLAAR